VRRKDTSEPQNVALASGGRTATAKMIDSSLLGSHSGRPRRKLPTSIAYIDPKPLTRRSITEMLTKALPDNVTIAASSCMELLEKRRPPSDWPHLVIVYTRSSGMHDGWVQGELELVRRWLPDAPVIVLSDRDDADEVVKALTCGVRGYIPTSIACEVAIAALGLVNAGGTYIPVHALGATRTEVDGAIDDEPSDLSDGLDLTHRERAVLHQLRNGNSNKRIATSLKMQESTVKVHVRNIFKKLHVANRTQAASIGNRLFGATEPTALFSPIPASTVPDRTH
jgi:DNA-binding NarL/FixJ family response regulator